jgi:S-(hydroxymethyl)glutathione dehydrogenase / alcohol dehydrogenase
MHAAILTEPGADVLVVDDVDVDQPRSGEALVEVVAAGVCGSDLSVWNGRMRHPTPAVLGHEAVGRVVQTGPGVHGLEPGARVVLWMRPPCRRCAACLRGEAGLCETSASMSVRGTLLDGRTSFTRGGEPLYRGLGVGAFAERVVMPATGLVPVPDDVPDDVAALCGCGVATGAGAVLAIARPEPGDTVLVLGGGGGGLAAAMAAAAVGAAAVVVADPVADRRRTALEVGATHAITGGDRKAVREQLQAALGHATVDVALDVVGHPDVLDTAWRTVRQGGTAVAVGVPAADAELRLPATLVTLAQKRLVGCFMGGIDPQRDLPRLFGLYRRGVLPIDRLITARRPLTEAPQALDDLAANRGVRTVLEVGG